VRQREEDLLPTAAVATTLRQPAERGLAPLGAPRGADGYFALQALIEVIADAPDVLHLVDALEGMSRPAYERPFPRL